MRPLRPLHPLHLLLMRVKISLLGVLLAGLLWSCKDETVVAGGASGIENPSVTLAFVEDGNPAALSGVLRVFPANSGLVDTNLFSRVLSNQDTASITARDFAALITPLMDSAARDSGLLLNIVISTSTREALLQGVRLRITSGGFVFEKVKGNTGDTVVGTPADSEGVLKINLALKAPVRDVLGRVIEAELPKGINVVFIPGSPYASLVDSVGGFRFSVLPVGVFQVVGFSVRDRAFFCSSDSLRVDPSSPPFVPSAWTACAGNGQWIPHLHAL